MPEDFPSPPKAPPLGFPLMAGLKSAFRATAAFVLTVLVVLGGDPVLAQQVAAVLPPRIVAAYLALVMLTGAVHNHLKNRPKA